LLCLCTNDFVPNILLGGGSESDNMKKTGLALVLLLGCGVLSWAFIRPPFTDLPRFVERHRDIVVADCVSIPPDFVIVDGKKIFLEYRGVYPFDVKVVRMLKGSLPPGNRRIRTSFTMVPGKRYLLSNLGYDDDFQALAELSVVEVSDQFDLSQLDGKPVKEQVASLLSNRLATLRSTIPKLEAERTLLEKAVHE